MKNSKEETVPIIDFDIEGKAKKKQIRLKGRLNNQFSVEGKWLRGSLHCHADPEKNPEWAPPPREHYREAGYDFVAGMDHDRIVKLEPDKNFLVVPGMEISGPCHFLAFDTGDIPAASQDGDRIEKTAAMIAKIKEAGGITVLAHPFKSGYTWSDLQVLCAAGLDGLEVVNSNVRGKMADAGRADQLWHGLLREGWYLFAAGGDDAHGSPEDVDEIRWGAPSHAGWTGVLARACSPEGVFDAMRNGRTYASEGPEFHRINFSGDGKLAVDCSPCVACHFRSVGGIWGGASVYPPEGNKEAEEFVLDFSEKGYRLQDYLVIVLQDNSGRRAWSSPIPLKLNITEE